MKVLAALALVAAFGGAGAAERSAWNSALANLKKRFESGPQDWTEWMKSLRKMHEQAAQKK